MVHLVVKKKLVVAESGSDSWKAYMRRMTVTVNYGSELPLARELSLMKNKVGIIGSGNIGWAIEKLLQDKYDLKIVISKMVLMRPMKKSKRVSK